MSRRVIFLRPSQFEELRGHFDPDVYDVRVVGEVARFTEVTIRELPIPRPAPKLRQPKSAPEPSYFRLNAVTALVRGRAWGPR